MDFVDEEVPDSVCRREGANDFGEAIVRIEGIGRYVDRVGRLSAELSKKDGLADAARTDQGDKWSPGRRSEAGMKIPPPGGEAGGIDGLSVKGEEPG